MFFFLTCFLYESSMVGSYFSTNIPCTNCTVSADLPTPPEPKTTILYSRILVCNGREEQEGESRWKGTGTKFELKKKDFLKNMWEIGFFFKEFELFVGAITI